MRLIVVVIVQLIAATCGHRILGLFPHPGLSHFHYFHPIMRALAEAGHDVTVVSHFPNKPPMDNYKDELLSDPKDGLTNSVSLDMVSQEKSYGHLMEFFFLRNWGLEECDATLNSTAIKNVLHQGRREPFDLVFIETFNTDCMMGIAHKINAPVIGLSSCNIMPWHFPKFGLPYEPGVYPTTFMGYSDKMTFGKRLSNWFTFVYMNVMYKYFNQRDANRLLRRRFGHDFPDVNELTKKISMVFVNQHYSLTGAKHLSPNVVELGGVHIGKPKPLDDDLKAILDSADQGVIYISWGSMVKADTLSDEKREGILKALSKFRQKILWKWENDTLHNQPANVVIRKWMPQREILCHKNVHVFMTHGGLLGSNEAAYCGVPVVATPFYGDQFLNAAALENRGMGVILKYKDITEQSVNSALRRVLDKRFRNKAKKVSYAYKHRPMSPTDSAVFWSEYVIATHGAELVKPYTVHAHWIVYSGLDIFLTVSIIILATIAYWIHLLKRFLGDTKKSKNQKVKKSNSNVSHASYHHHKAE